MSLRSDLGNDPTNTDLAEELSYSRTECGVLHAWGWTCVHRKDDGSLGGCSVGDEPTDPLGMEGMPACPLGLARD